MTPEQIERCRQRFESWVSGQNVCKKYGALLHKNADGSYRDYRINDRWNAWKAAMEEQPSGNPCQLPAKAIVARGWYHRRGDGDYDLYDAKDEHCDRCTEVLIVRADAIDGGAQ